MTQPSNNHYQALGLQPTATAHEIRATFRRLAKAQHPDVSKDPDATSKFQTILIAYKTLSEEEKRRRYDQSLKPPSTSKTQPIPSKKTPVAKSRPAVAPDPKRICPTCQGIKNPEYQTCYNCRPKDERCPNCNRFKRSQWPTCYRCAFPKGRNGKNT